MNSVLGKLKSRIRRVTWLYEPVRSRRAKRQEVEYISLREQYYKQAGHVFAVPGYLARSAALLKKRWDGPGVTKSKAQDVRLFVVATEALAGPKMFESFCKNFDTVIFDIGQYHRAGQTYCRERLQRDMVDASERTHAEKPIDLVFAYVSHRHVDPDVLRRIKADYGVPIANLWLDDKHVFLDSLIGSVDVHLTNSLECVRWYLANGVPTYHMPQGVNPDIFKPLSVEKDIDVCFIGGRYGARGHFIETLQEAGIHVQCFGRGWGTRGISDREKIEIYNRSRIVLGVRGTGFSERITCVKSRDFEVPACGALYLTGYNSELASLYHIGKEILCYYNEIDCVELIRYYLDRPEAAEAIGRAGRERCLREHTWKHRIIGLLEWMGILRSQPAQ